MLYNHHDSSAMDLIPKNNSNQVHSLDDNGDKKAAVLLAKTITMIVLCSVSIGMGILPLQMDKWMKWTSSKSGNTARSSKLVGLLLGFGGGVLFCTTFLHLLPEVGHRVKLLVKKGVISETHLPIAEILTCVGFFVMYLVEELVHIQLKKKQSHKSVKSNVDIIRRTKALAENGVEHLSISNRHNHVCAGHSHLPVSDDGESLEISSLRGLLIVLGLSVHECFEGLTIGLECSTTYVWYMFAAVAAHKFVIAFCIGVELIAAKTKTHLTIIYVSMFALVSPLGIGIGMVLVGDESAATSGPLPVFLQGIASGTLLYVVFFEVLHEHRTGIEQYLSILVGFIMMFSLQVLTPVMRSVVVSPAHGHSHG